MPAYQDFPRVIRYERWIDFGDGDDVISAKGPKGKKGRLLNYGVYGISETFNSVTTEGMVAVGNASDPDAYGEEFSVGDAAADTAGEVSIDTTYRKDQVGGGAGVTDRDDYILNDGELPADTAIYLTCTAPTGGTPAGQAVAFMDIMWDN